jgi:hypothetical protein
MVVLSSLRHTNVQKPLSLANSSGDNGPVGTSIVPAPALAQAQITLLHAILSCSSALPQIAQVNSPVPRRIVTIPAATPNRSSFHPGSGISSGKAGSASIIRTTADIPTRASSERIASQPEVTADGKRIVRSRPIAVLPTESATE